MFLDNFILLNEDGDEPTEEDADMGNGDSGTDDGEDDGSDELDDDGGDELGDDDSDGDSDGGDDLGGDGGDGSEESEMTADEAMKKRQLFSKFKTLLELQDSLLDSINFIDVSNFTHNESKIYNFLQTKMKENQEKTRIIVIEQFAKLSYRQLLTLFLYLKMSTKSYADIINNIINN